jgi:hypothetical protein
MFRTASPFYSPTERALERISQKKGTPEQFKAMLLKNGAKEAELDWMGWDDFSQDKKSLTKEDIQQWINQNKVEIEEVEKKEDVVYDVFDSEGNKLDGVWSLEQAQKLAEKKNGHYDQSQDILKINDTKYSQYQLPGGTNYKEVLLTMPSKGKVITPSEKEEMESLARKMNNQKLSDKDLNRYNELRKKAADNFDNKDIFKSSHWEEPNVLVHARIKDYTDTEGRKLLHLEELQSDWQQEGKKEGFAAPFNSEQAKEKVDEIRNRVASGELTQGEAIPMIESYTQKISTVPDMPFKQTSQWVNLALRRMARYAAENGYDGISWTP